MFNYQITFHSPWYLLLLLLVPVVWALSFRSMGALGAVRRVIALVFRTVVMVLLIMAIAEVQMVRTSDRLTVIYLLDQSLSIPSQQRRAMIQYVNGAIEEHRQREDRVGVIVFGRDAAIEIPPFDDDVQVPPAIESLLNPEHTNLAAAMKLAQASFPEDAAKRIVIVSDGNENLGDAIEQARGLAGSGIGIDVVPIRYSSRSEVVVERLAIPSDVRRGQPFDLNVVVNNTTKPTAGRSGEITGNLVLTQLAGDRSAVLSEQRVTLPPGKSVFSIRQQIDSPAFYKYEARFTPDNPDDDAVPQNNRATTFTHVRGKGQVLLIEDYEHPGEFKHLVDSLRRQGLEVTVQPSNRLFVSLAELQPYDTVVLANVPRSTNQDVHFTDDQVEMLVRNTQQMGAGLVMLGGPGSFGAGGWTNTKLEEAMPVDFQIKSAKVVPRGALAMLMHACEIPQGNHWQKVITREALKALGPQDYCGVIHWSGREQWLWGGMKVVGSRRKQMLGRIDRMTPGDMPDFDPSMVMAQRAFAKLPDAAVKHMIVISDGDPAPPSRRVTNALAALKVTVSTVAVGAHGPAGSRVLNRLATATGGKYYKVRSPKALPRIFQREARRVARPLIYEKPVQPRIRFPHEMISGIDDPLPVIKGFVMTSVKENPLVEVALVSPWPTDERNATILASWTYGLGKAVALTTDAGARWADRWTGWENYDKFFGQMIRYSMRPGRNAGKFTVSTRVQDGRAQVVVSALDKDDEFLNFLSMSGTAVCPNLKPISVKIQQTAPGRYVGSFPAEEAGSYFLLVSPGAGQAPIRTGINVPYSSEFRDRATNEALLEQLAGLVPKGGPAGLVIEAAKGSDEVEQLLSINTFRHNLPKATSSQDAWHYLVLVGSCLFFFDVFIRRVQIGFGWVPSVYGRVRDHVMGREPQPREVEYMERLRSRKAEVSDRLEQLRAGARFEAPAEAPDKPEAVEELTGGPTTPPPPRPSEPTMTPEKETEKESYTERLLRAKKQVWQQREKNR